MPGDKTKFFVMAQKIFHPTLKCRICGNRMYITDHGYHELTYHCFSYQARFWDYERGCLEQFGAKEHWDKSKTEIFLDNRDIY
jgi:hypothetical protein